MTLDLILLAADKDIEQALRGILSRPEALGIQPIDFTAIVHPHKDPGCFTTGHELLSTYRKEAKHGLVVFDADWEGGPSASVQAQSVDERLKSAWGANARSIVIDPEVENWLWSDSPHVSAILGWSKAQPLRDWLATRELWPLDEDKPPNPKRALLETLKVTHVPNSASLFRKVAEKVSVRRCIDPAFLRLTETLRQWFP